VESRTRNHIRDVRSTSKRKEKKRKGETCKGVGTRTYLPITHKTKGIEVHTHLVGYLSAVLSCFFTPFLVFSAEKCVCAADPSQPEQSASSLRQSFSSIFHHFIDALSTKITIDQNNTHPPPTNFLR
jgi:hypothetical protein